MKICLLHNFYQQSGGEDSVFKNERDLLAAKGHKVLLFTKHNDEIQQYSTMQKATMLYKTTHNASVKKAFKKYLQIHQPDIIHAHNTFPLLSPAVLAAGQEMRIPVIQTLHNYRLFCPNAVFYRSGKVCEDCFGEKFAMPAVKNACYRDSKVQSLTVAGMLAFHHWRKTWQKNVDVFIAITEFVKSKFVQAGFAKKSIVVKPHFVLRTSEKESMPGDYFLYVGRLSEEKGIRELLRAWQMLKGIPLKIAGDGPLKEELIAFARKNALDCIEFLGKVPGEDLTALYENARSVIIPSVCYETFGLVAAEAYACSAPVIASNHGALSEVVQDKNTGFHFPPGDRDKMAEKVKLLWEDEGLALKMGRVAKKEYAKKFAPDVNYEMLRNIYTKAIANKSQNQSIQKIRRN